MIRYIALLAIPLLLTVACSSPSDTDTTRNRMPTLTGTKAQTEIPKISSATTPTPTRITNPAATFIPSTRKPLTIETPSPKRLRSEGRGLVNLKEGIAAGDVLLDFDRECGVNGFPWVVGQLDNDQIKIKLTDELASDFTLSEASTPSELGITNVWVKVRPDENQRWETRQEGSWLHEFNRTSLPITEKAHIYKLPISVTGFRIDLKVELEIVSNDGQNCSVVAYEKVSRSHALYPTALPNQPTEAQQPNFTKYETILTETLPEPDVQALMLAASWWEDRGVGSENTLPGETSPRPDGKLGEYVDVYVHKPISHGTPLKVGIYGLPNDEIMRDFRDAFEILGVIAPSLKANFALTPDEVTLWVHYVDNCKNDSVLGKDLYADSKCAGLGYADNGPDQSKPWHGEGFGAIQMRASDWQELEDAIITLPDTHDGRYGALTSRASVFHELGHAVGLRHNRCAKSQMRAPNGNKQPLGWSAEDLKAISAIHNPKMPQGYFTNNDYDISRGWKQEGKRHSYGATLVSLSGLFDDLIDKAEWNRILDDRQAMCEVDLTDTYWSRLQEVYETQYSTTPRFSSYFAKKETWPNLPDCYEHNAAKDQRACGR